MSNDDIIYQSKGALIAFLENEGFVKGGGSSAPEYVTLSTDPSLANERVLTAGTGITVTDAGAGSTVTVASTITQGAAISGTPANNELAVWTDASTIEGESGLTYYNGQLYVNDDSDIYATLGKTSDTNTEFARLQLKANKSSTAVNGFFDARDSAARGGLQLGTISDHAIYFYQNNGIAMVIESDKQVGITSNLGVSGSTTLGNASGDNVTINAQTIDIPNINTGTDNSVLVYNESSIVTDEIDPKVWAGALVDYTGTPSNNQVAIWTDTDTLEGDSDLTFDGTALTMLTSSATIAQTRLIEYTDGTDAMTVLSDGTISLARGNIGSPSVQTVDHESDGDGEWTKIMSHGALGNYWAPSVVALVTLSPMGYASAGLGEHYEFIVTCRWSRFQTSASTYAAHTDITVQPLNNAALNGWDPTTDIILTYNAATAAEIWIKGLSDYTSCEVTILGGTPAAQPAGSYNPPGWQIEPYQNSTWTTFSSLGAFIYGTWAPGQDSATSVFSAYGNADQALSAASWTTVEFNTEDYDVGGDFNTTTDTFTAPTTGKYMLSTQVRLSSVDSSTSQYVWIKIITSNRTYYHLNGVRYRGGGAYSTPALSVVADMDAGDTAYVQVLVNVGASTTQGSGAAQYTAFQGCLIG